MQGVLKKMQAAAAQKLKWTQLLEKSSWRHVAVAIRSTSDQNGSMSYLVECNIMRHM